MSSAPKSATGSTSGVKPVQSAAPAAKASNPSTTSSSAAARPAQAPAKGLAKAPASTPAGAGAKPAGHAAGHTTSFAAKRPSDGTNGDKRGSGDSTGSSRRRVVWDEQNLEANEEYQRAHPVTMHIDEPKTPYVHIDDDVEAMMDSGDSQWDPKVNAYVKKVKEQAHQDQRKTAPVAPVAKNGRPMLAAGTTNGDLERDKHDREFRSMRKAVYADEGAKFKEMLAKEKAQGPTK